MPALGQEAVEGSKDEVLMILVALWNQKCYYQWYKKHYGTRDLVPQRNPDIYRQVSTDLRIFLESSDVDICLERLSVLVKHRWFMFTCVCMVSSLAIGTTEAAPVGVDGDDGKGRVQCRI
eukprot:gene14859-biopygen1081